MDPGRCAGIFAERPTEWIAVSRPSKCWYSQILQLRVHDCACQHYYNAIFIHSACVHVHVHVRVYMHTYNYGLFVGMRIYSSTGPVASL